MMNISPIVNSVKCTCFVTKNTSTVYSSADQHLTQNTYIVT